MATAVVTDASATVAALTLLAPFAPTPLAAATVLKVVAAAILALSVSGAYGARALGAPTTAVLRAGLLVAVMLGWQVAAMEPQPQASRFALVALSLAATLVLAGRWASSHLDGVIARLTRSASTAVVVGSRAQYEAVLDAERSHRSREHEIVGWVAPGGHRPQGALGTLGSLTDLIAEREIETVFVGGALRADRLQRVSDACTATGCELLYPTHAVSPGGVQPRLVWRHSRPYFELGTPVLPIGADAT